LTDPPGIIEPTPLVVLGAAIAMQALLQAMVSCGGAVVIGVATAAGSDGLASTWGGLGRCWSHSASHS
jgi:hypothetical protein